MLTKLNTDNLDRTVMCTFSSAEALLYGSVPRLFIRPPVSPLTWACLSYKDTLGLYLGMFYYLGHRDLLYLIHGPNFTFPL